MALENNWQSKSLDELEKTFSASLHNASYLTARSIELRKVTLDKFSIEDLRLMIGQQIGLKYLIPLAIAQLNKNIFAEGDYYPGDLLKNVLAVDPVFWKNNHNLWLKVNDLIKERRKEFTTDKISTALFDTIKNKDSH